ncbi:hypothetical protein CN311_07375 [Mesorhizobium sanjuanii]|uniref:Uncharacterized protein n=2 Tax=Mesorhizobium sanjuanii TaxID=2037900 RepID=A0A2A6FJZ6_9HYPH|nr:hypothetical protein CN311_07375 [Mesorhizobium sanjuanii]
MGQEALDIKDFRAVSPPIGGYSFALGQTMGNSIRDSNPTLKKGDALQGILGLPDQFNAALAHRLLFTSSPDGPSRSALT